LCIGHFSFSQNSLTSLPRSASSLKQSLQTSDEFIENIGQYGNKMVGYENMGAIKFAYEGLGMPVLFTSKGLIHLQRKVEKISHADEERLEKQGIAEEIIEHKKNVTNRTICMEWLHSNPDVEIISEEKSFAYHTYRLLSDKAYGYKKIIYKNIYPGIDVVYSFIQNQGPGFEYSLKVQPGADLSVVKLKYSGDVKTIKTDKKGQLLIQSDIEGISISIPVSYYGESLLPKSISEVKTIYKVEGNQISFSFPDGYDTSKALVIDPFVSGTGNLSGLNSGKAKDVDFDYAGNIFVTGGGAFTSSHSLAKFSANGILQWTFNGTLAIPSWTYGTYYGGWMVEKPTGNIYLGQGFNPATGFQVIRVSATGLFDNYITTANPSFMESWKMYWSCNNGSPQILVAGGGTNSNINFGVFTPPATSITGLNITGTPYAGSTGWAQDIVDFVFDPTSNEMYSIFGSLFGTPSISNKIYKNTAPYSAATVAWNVPSGYSTIQEAANRPYLVTSGMSDNSANMLSVNASYLYYWDGKNLKAFNKTTGAGVGTSITTANTAFMQGGIIADACDHIFVGEGNGIIKVYQFNGSNFSDAPADISIPGFTGKAVYDLAYDESKKLLYASGDGFVASFDISSYCPTTLYSLNVVPNCLTSSATAIISPTPPIGSVVTYSLFIGATQIASNTTGLFAGLNPNVTYTIVATINLACSGSQASTTFIVPGPTVVTASTNTICGNSIGTISAIGSGTTAPYTYSIDGTNFQASGLFSGLAAGVYIITVKDANGCKTAKILTLLNSNGPVLTYTSTNADCGNNNGTITANVTAGIAPYQYSINGSTYQNSQFFTGLVGGSYTLTVKDASGCTNAVIISISSSSSPLITAIPASATCGNNNGTITAFGTSGTIPLEYSINGNIFQTSNVFTNLAAGNYTVTVKDANGCMKTTTVIVENAAAPTVNAVSSTASCANVNGTITASGSGGIAPYQYSINGINFQSGNIFTGLAGGLYTITIKDNTGCTNITTVSIASTNGPNVSAVSTVSACNGSDGTITVTASGGTPGYQYSINGSIYQVSNILTGVAAGNYVVYVKDAASCIGTFVITVGTTAGPLIAAVATTTACNINNGTITASGSAGTAPLLYSIDGITYTAGNVFTGLTTGIYTVYVKDVNGCLKTTVVTVANVSGLSLTASSIASSCSLNSGTITATATSGVAPLQYSVNGIVYQASNIFSGMAPGVYTVYVKDANACIVTKQVTVTAASGLTLVLINQQNGTCGNASGVIRVTGSGGIAPLSYNIDGGAFQAFGVFINVATGLHTIMVKDATGCSISQSVTIANSGVGTPPTNVTFTVRDALGCTGATGRIKNLKGLPSGGGATYIFSLDGGPFTTANQFTNVSQGVHTITAQNEQGCNVTRIVTIGSGVAASATATSTATACSASTGTITITGIGANTPYHASINGIAGPWNTFASSFTFTGLAAGTYSIIIADDADFITGPPDIPGTCLTTIYVAVPSTGGPTITTSQINATCSSNNGSITVTGSAGTAPYTYNINGGTYFTSPVFNNLAPGVYSVTVKDATGCITGTNVTLANPSVPAVTAVIDPSTCNLNNGSITATGTGGAAPLQYSINGTVFQSSNIFSNLAPGNYTLYVADANNCYGTLPVSITNIPIPKVTAFTILATCTNSDGSIVATGSLGTAPYTFSINGTVYQSSSTFTNLNAGFYTIYIKDANGCISTTGMSLGNTSAAAITNITSQSAHCNNSTGSITVTAFGGIGALEFSIDGINFQTLNIFTGLLPGNYIVTVKDANGCLTTQIASVGNTNGPQLLTAVLVNAACGLNNGSVTATATGGTGALQYSIDGIIYQASAIFNAVAAGTYILYVKDANGCIKTLPVTILNLTAPSLTATSSPASCGLGDGTITAIATGGTSVLSYSLDGITFQTSNIFLNLTAGAYTIIVKDARGCTNSYISTVATLGVSNTPTFAAVAPICSGAILSALPILSENGINGTWSPALNNTTTTIYTFTPLAGQCATIANLTITVNPKPSLIIIYHN
jgi:hypothetical protein